MREVKEEPFKIESEIENNIHETGSVAAGTSDIDSDAVKGSAPEIKKTGKRRTTVRKAASSKSAAKRTVSKAKKADEGKKVGAMKNDSTAKKRALKKTSAEADELDAEKASKKAGVSEKKKTTKTKKSVKRTAKSTASKKVDTDIKKSATGKESLKVKTSDTAKMTRNKRGASRKANEKAVRSVELARRRGRKAAAEKKETRVRRTARKPEFKFILQYSNNDYEYEMMQEKILKDYKDSGYTETIKTLAIYCKPEEGKCYYVVNDITAGHVDL